MSCRRIELSNSQTLVLDAVETGIFLFLFAQQLRLKNADVPDIYFTLLEAASIPPTLIPNQNAKTKQRGSWSLSKSERQKLQRPYTQGGAANESVRNLLKASNLPVSRVRQFLHSKISYKKITLPTVNSTESSHLLDSKTNFSVRTWHTMTN